MGQLVTLSMRTSVNMNIQKYLPHQRHKHYNDHRNQNLKVQVLPLNIDAGSGIRHTISNSSSVTPRAVQRQEPIPLTDIDFADNPYPESDVFTDPNADYDPDFDGEKGERRFKLNPYPTPRRIEIPDRRTSHNNYVIKKTKEIEENSEEPYQSRSSTSNLEDLANNG